MEELERENILREGNFIKEMKAGGLKEG